MVELRKSNWETLGGLPIPAYHVPDDSVETPGSAPYTRGIHEKMYRSRLWTMRQYAGFSSAQETNERFRLLLDRGQKGLSVAFDLPPNLAWMQMIHLAREKLVK